MAESQAVAFKKLEDQLTCAICLDALRDPKLLQCFHVYCKDCLQQLVVTDRQGQLSLCCPTCRQPTLLPPATGVSGLQSAFHIHHLFEIREVLKRVEDSQKMQCDKCTKTMRTATNFCQDCGKFICERCTEMHSEWEEISKHKVVSMEQILNNLKLLVPSKKVTLYCSQHEGMKLDLYCETCGEFICLHCTIRKHKEHQYDLVGDTFERHKAEITASLEPIKEQLDVSTKALEQFDVQSQKLDELEVVMEASIGQEIQRLQELLEARKAKLVGEMKQLIEIERKTLEARKVKVEIVYTQRDSCLSFVRESLRTGSQEEVIKMKKAVGEQIKEMTDKFKLDMMPPCELADIKIIPFSFELTQSCQQIGKVYIPKLFPEKCYATGRGKKIAELGKRASAVVYVVDQVENAYTAPIGTLTCEMSNHTGEKVDCRVIKTNANLYEISYQATSLGEHHLHIQVEGKHINGSPFPVTVIKKLGTPIKTINGVKVPWGVAVNQSGEVIVGEDDVHCVSIFSATGKKLRSFGSRGSEQGQFEGIRGVAVDDCGFIFVTDRGNHRIQKFAPDGKFIAAIGKRGNNFLEYDVPIGITIHPVNKKVYVADNNNHRLQILNPDLTFSSSFGSYGSNNGQFKSPSDVAFDSTGNVYVADTDNNRIQVFTAEGVFLREFQQRFQDGIHGQIEYYPSSLCVDGDSHVYVTDFFNHHILVFTSEGKFLSSFGESGRSNEPGMFKNPYGIAVDKDGLIYVSDTGNFRLQIF